MKRAIILVASLWLGAAPALELPVQGMRLNPALQLQVKELQPPRPDGGFLISAENDKYEVMIKGVPMANAKAAEQMARVELGNIKNLYNPHGSPYAGQISDLIECQKSFSPKSGRVHVGGAAHEALYGGTNGRKLFGACTSDQIEYWGGYFNFYDTHGARSIDVRIYAKAHSPKPVDVGRLNQSVGSFADRLIQVSRP
jgi:hypothetical protein